jgi:hypothetical protein
MFAAALLDVFERGTGLNILAVFKGGGGLWRCGELV